MPQVETVSSGDFFSPQAIAICHSIEKLLQSPPKEDPSLAMLASTKQALRRNFFSG
jgi:hypothetical protein